MFFLPIRPKLSQIEFNEVFQNPLVQDRANSANEIYDEDTEFNNHTLVLDDESSNHSPLVLTHDEIYNTLYKLSPRKAPGPDAIPNWIPREYSVFLAKPITSILNSSYQYKEIPSIWNYANVTPLPKEILISISDQYHYTNHIKGR